MRNLSRRDLGLATAASVAVGLAGQSALMISGPLRSLTAVANLSTCLEALCR